MEPHKKKVLIIAYAFPPHSVVGSMRPLRMAKYLKDVSGWNPVILTVDRVFARNDDSLIEEVPHGVPIYRVGSFEPAFWFERMRHAIEVTRSDASKTGLRVVRKVFDRAFSVLSEASSIPDPQVFWNVPVVQKGMSIIRSEGIDAVLVTSPPWSLQMAGFMLRKTTGVPWVADYRDPWTDIRRKDRPSFIDACERWLEKHLLEGADLVLSTSDTYSKDLAERFSAKHQGKFKTLHNGYDEVKFRLPEARAGYPRFTIAHLGTLYSETNPYAFLDTLKGWTSIRAGIEAGFELLFVGGINEQTRRAIDEAGLGHVTRVTGFVPHREAISLCAGADVLLLSLGNTEGLPRGWLPSKLFEYLAMERPVLAYTVEGEAAAMVRDINRGHVATSADHSTTRAFLDNLFQRKWQNDNLYIPWRNDPVPMEKIRQSYLMKRLGGLLDGIAR